MEFILTHWEKLMAPVTGIAVWYYTKRTTQKSNEAIVAAEATSAHLGNITSNFKVYQELINDLEERFKKRIEDLEEDLDKMRVLNEQLRKAIAGQEKYINKLLTKLGNYEDVNK